MSPIIEAMKPSPNSDRQSCASLGELFPKNGTAFATESPTTFVSSRPTIFGSSRRPGIAISFSDNLVGSRKWPGPEVGDGNAATRFHQSAWLSPAHKETAGPCVRIVEDGELSCCRQTPFAALPSMRNLAPEIRGGKHERSRRRDPDSQE